MNSTPRSTFSVGWQAGTPEGSAGHDRIAQRLDGKPWAADIHLTPMANFFTPRAHHQHACGFRVDPKTGMLASIDSLSDRKAAARLQHRSDRPLSAVGRPIINSMTSYAIDKATGKLSKLREYPMGRTRTGSRSSDSRGRRSSTMCRRTVLKGARSRCGNQPATFRPPPALI